MSHQLLVGLRRFVKGFVAGGLAQVTLILSAGMTFEQLKDINALIAVIATGFLSGGLLAIEKMLSYVPNEEK